MSKKTKTLTDKQIQNDILELVRENGDPERIVETLYERYGYELHKADISPSQNIIYLLREGKIQKDNGRLKEAT